MRKRNARDGWPIAFRKRGPYMRILCQSWADVDRRGLIHAGMLARA